MTFSMSELNRTTKLLIETDEEDPDEGPQKSAKEIEEEKKAEKAAQQKMVFSFKDNKNGHILPTGQWYAPSAVIKHPRYCMVLHGIAW